MFAPYSAVMSLGIVVVSVDFGLAMGYGLGAFLDDVRPSLLALAVALAAGVTVLSASLGPDPEAVGGSLVLGAVAGLVGLGSRRVGRRPDGSAA